MYRFKIRKDEDGWRALFYSTENGKLIWWTEGYSSYANAENAVNIIRAYASTTPLV